MSYVDNWTRNKLDQPSLDNSYGKILFIVGEKYPRDTFNFRKYWVNSSQ